MSTVPPLRKRHPNLFKTILLVGVSNLIIATFTLLDSPRAAISFTRITSIAFVHHPKFWFVLFFIAALMCLHGALTPKYQMARVGLVLSAAIGGFLAIGFWISYFSTGTIGVSAPVIWSFYTLVCIINSSEPTVNPLSVVLQQDIHKTLSGEKHTKGNSHGGN